MTISIELPLDNYCVIGNPIAHTKSPQIHTAFAEQTRQAVSYQAILVEKSKFQETIQEFQGQGVKGLNVTVPFKVEAWEATDHRSSKAERARAVNTISFDDGKIIGDNTDGIGLVRDLTGNHNVSIKYKNILILGAGGAVRGIIDPLFDEEPGRVVIANRTISRAKNLADAFSDRGSIAACGFTELIGSSFDIIINGTSASLQGDALQLPERLIDINGCCYDMMYSMSDTPFISWARGQGIDKTFDGLGMLVEQAAESFFIWRGVRPETGSVIELVRKCVTDN